MHGCRPRARPGSTRRRPPTNRDDDADEPEVADDESEAAGNGRPPRYRAGRGGFDAEAAALTARARYAFRQRVVLALLVLRGR